MARIIAVAVAVALALAGCATQAEREAAAAQTRAEWEACVDEYLAMAWLLDMVFKGDVDSAVTAEFGQNVARECGTGGLTAAERARYVLTVSAELEKVAEPG